jgi:hypothetical protein
MIIHDMASTCYDATWLHKAHQAIPNSMLNVEVEVSKDRASFAFFHLPTRTRRLAIIGKYEHKSCWKQRRS